MARLSYRTKANERPQGKPNVYFSCHPDDFGIYFEEFAGMILSIQDCAIWYESEPEADYDREELELDLSQMQLLVMPVTTKLLTTANRAIDVELPISQEKHIPVLPLMMEHGLDDLFSKRFGDLQYLDPNDRDETRRSFDEVLKTYIKSVLVSNELAERVRAAFDAYIFLSYRKKDRRQAQSLMRLIHSNPLCRDIAIWYDEFLTPGEDFNQAIEKMLQKSDLFALVVTPNLVNEVNYVMTTEYPAAIEQEKPVLPVEMEETDRSRLEEHYGAIPPCVRGEESENFTAVLTDMIRRIAVKANDSDPVHNYLIGLAYLDGIDVEIDPARALELITGAAEAGVPEAMVQLFNMYERGKGVARDFVEGVRWRACHVDYLKKEYGSAPTEEKADELIDRLWGLGDARYELRDLDAAASAYEEMNSLAEECAASGSEQSRRLLALSCQKLGGTAKARGDLTAAQKYYERALSVSRELAEQVGTAEARRSLWASYVFLGDISRERGDYAEAWKYYEQACAITEELVRQTETIGSRRDLWVSYEKLGDTAMARGDLAEAQRYYEADLAIMEEITRHVKTVNICMELSISYSRVGDTAKDRKDYKEAQKYYKAALSISDAVAKEVRTIETRRQLSVSYHKLGLLSEEIGDLAEAQRYYELDLGLSDEIAKQAATIESLTDLLAAYEALGRVMEARKDLSGAKILYDYALRLSDGLSDKTGKTDIKECLLRNCMRLGSIAEGNRDLAAAQKYYERAVSVREDLPVRGDEFEANLMLWGDYEKITAIATQRGDAAGILKYRQKVLFITIKLGQLCMARMDLKNSRAFYKRTCTMCQWFIEQTGSIPAMNILSKIYLNLIVISEAMGDLAEAENYQKLKAANDELLGDRKE